MPKLQESTPEDKSTAAPTVEQQPMLPEKQGGPAKLQRAQGAGNPVALPLPGGAASLSRAGEFAANPGGGGAADRARLSSALQWQVGNARSGWILGAAVQSKLTVGAANDIYEQETDRVADHVMRMPAGEKAPPAVRHSPGPRLTETRSLQRQPATGQASAPAQAPATPALSLSPRDAVVSFSVLNTLDRFQNMPIDVVGSQPMPPGFIGPPPPRTVTVSVHAQYFINTETARNHYQAARRTARFSSIIRALEQREEMSLLEGSGRRRSAGRAVELGKSTPEDIKKFVEEALAQDIIRDYAIRHRVIRANQQLVDLAPDDLQALIQRWMRETGVGVDCSGFVQQAAIEARELERGVISLVNMVRGALGLPPIPLPPEISREERRAASFANGPRVREPRDLRPGDAWVVTGGGHVRIVALVREVTLPSGATTIEFETAESSGGSTQPEPGPVQRTWQTHTLTRFQPITAVGHTTPPRGGSFHRIQ
jgi:cell wall-associated NlpC family hydrolase